MPVARGSAVRVRRHPRGSAGAWRRGRMHQGTGGRHLERFLLPFNASYASPRRHCTSHTSTAQSRLTQRWVHRLHSGPRVWVLGSRRQPCEQPPAAFCGQTALRRQRASRCSRMGHVPVHAHTLRKQPTHTESLSIRHWGWRHRCVWDLEGAQRLPHNLRQPRSRDHSKHWVQHSVYAARCLDERRWFKAPQH